MNRFYVLFFIMVFCNPILPQSLDDIFHKIDLKLSRDKSYLNLHYIDFIASDIKDFPVEEIPRTNERDPFTFKNSENITYRLVLMLEGVGVDSTFLMYLEERKSLAAGGESFIGDVVDGPREEISRALSFKDLYYLRNEFPEIYTALYQVYRNFKKVNEDPPPSLLAINVDNEIKTSIGIAARDNSDYLAFHRMNNIHWYMKEEKKVTGRRGEATAKSDFRLDASFSQVTFSHELMKFGGAIGGVEFGFIDRSLNLLPYQAMSMTTGFRTLISLSESKSDLNKALMVDARFLGRVRANTDNLGQKLPFVQAEKARLNVGTAAGADLSFTRPFQMPFLNLYFATGGAYFTKPYIKLGPTTAQYAYSTFTQAEMSFAFYWNTSDKKTTKFRIDVGAGYHDIWKSYYRANGTFSGKKELRYDKVSPMVALHFNFSPANSDLLYSKIRIYDSRVLAQAWIKLAEFGNGLHSFRFEGMYLTPAVARKKYDWENDGGVILQIRYRLGM
ncbi:MAG: hypothetical protein KF721_10560 [Ignavibacteriaceae bacterium]|nr:hypothetical protein [Ignavibacteriaceae bacterium]